MGTDGPNVDGTGIFRNDALPQRTDLWLTTPSFVYILERASRKRKLSLDYAISLRSRSNALWAPNEYNTLSVASCRTTCGGFDSR